MRTIHRLLAVMAATLLLLVLPTAARAQMAELEASVRAFNQVAPVSAGSIGEITRLDLGKSTLTFNFAMDESLCHIDNYNLHPDAAKRSIAVTMSNGTGDMATFVHQMARAHVGLILVYKGKTSGKVARISFTPAEVQAMSANPDRRPLTLLQAQVDAADLQCPITTEVGITGDRVSLDSSNAVYHFTVDESKYSMAALRQNAGVIRQNLLASFQSGDPAKKLFIGYCISAGRGLRYVYEGSTTHEKFSIEFTPSDLGKM